ncbi:MAG: M20 family peptidase [Planctomycetia bacterium]|nr:M20 family peptidase [Planctomycetia bacterium]
MTCAGSVPDPSSRRSRPSGRVRTMPDHVDTLADLVRRPSVNPMGREVSGPEYLEGRVTDYLVQRFSAAGIPWARQQVAPGRDNVVARLEATEPEAPTLLWDAHQDTVPADGMTIEPFVPAVRDGRMHGRGACDVKGGMAAMLTAMDRLLASGGPRWTTVVFVATVNEEFGFSGARALARLWAAPAPASASDAPARELVAGRPAAAIVAEPTELDIVTTHKGAVRWRARLHGRSCHSAFPEQGANAIYPAGRAVLAIESLAAELLGRAAGHPCGPPTLNVGTIHGGSGVNLVPELVVLEIERRLLPGESPRHARDEVIARIAAATGDARVEHDDPFLESPGLPDEAADIADRLAEVAHRRGAGARRIAARYGTNASVLSAAGVPSVVFGPGSIAQAHTADEWIDLAQVDAAADIFAGLVASPPGRR